MKEAIDLGRNKKYNEISLVTAFKCTGQYSQDFLVCLEKALRAEEGWLPWEKCAALLSAIRPEGSASAQSCLALKTVLRRLNRKTHGIAFSADQTPCTRLVSTITLYSCYSEVPVEAYGRH